ncbi:hypothetical protein [Agrococcus sp. SGAir0287]|uniref:hypothetical protein n=1 Tax=Agrococcus sp. SGAir0287 TaxID=2070347 RepID=UPI0010CCC6DF|nr:hypothetical protein [Agrococcus sp. SGAir0287]QCR18185.1 hypothetical protein C1N71_00935 [Agrococcus sp. SGAir0287]
MRSIASAAVSSAALLALAACSSTTVAVPEPVTTTDGSPTLVVDGRQIAGDVSCTIVDRADGEGIGALVSATEGSFTATLEQREGETVVTAVMLESDSGEHVLAEETRAGTISGRTVSFEVVVPGLDGAADVGVAFAGECMRL